jgi:hypothetical protein
MSVRWLKNGSFGFACVSACAVGAKPNVPFVRLAKLFLKKCVGKKIKNIGSAMSVGLLAVHLQYRFYVVGHLSKWFTFYV